MEKKPWSTGMKIAVGISVGLASLMMLAVISSTPDSEKMLPVEQQNQAVVAYYKKLNELNLHANTAYYKAAKKATDGDVQGAYSDFKGNVELEFRGLGMVLTELKSEIPNVPDKKLLSDALEKLRVSANVRHDAIELFLEGVEENKEGKFLEAKAKNERAEGYLQEFHKLMEEIANKHGV